MSGRNKLFKDSKHLGLILDRNTYHDLRKEAYESNGSVSEFVRGIIDLYLDVKDDKVVSSAMNDYYRNPNSYSNTLQAIQDLRSS